MLVVEDAGDSNQLTSAFAMNISTTTIYNSCNSSLTLSWRGPTWSA